MRHRKTRIAGQVPQFIDPAFADALAGSESSENRSRKPDYKTLQLCRQVQRTLNRELDGDCGDEILAELYVEEVTPAPSASHLLVHVVVPPNRMVIEVLEHLGRAMPRLRAEVARAITRKRAPELTFVPAVHGEVHP